MLLPSRLLEADGGEDNRLGVSSVFHGPEPELHLFDTPQAESAAVAGWIDDCLKQGIAPETITVLVRSGKELPRARAAISASLGKFRVRHPYA
ncbi:MAG: hypothetical protein EOS11_18335 [Mesorhizobium sp.]|nr:MAG: hypothetical protein EOS11_18335 [Mesorhizobium sp.]